MLPRHPMRLILWLGLMLRLLTVAVSAQQLAAPRYRLTFMDNAGVTADQCRVRFSVGVNNSGGVPAETVQLVLSSTTGVLASVDVAPIQTDRQRVIEISASVENIPVGEQIFTLDLQFNGADYADTPALQRPLTIPTFPPSCANDGEGQLPIVIPFINIEMDLMNLTVDELAFLGGILLVFVVISIVPIMLLRQIRRRARRNTDLANDGKTKHK